MDEDADVKEPRKDIVATQSSALSREAEKVVAETSTYATPAMRQERRARASADKRFALRKTLVESDRSDPNGFERIIGDSDLMSINFLDRGRRAAAAVCRIKVPSDGGAWYGTGFLVGPRLLLTNHHVLGNAGLDHRRQQRAGELAVGNDRRASVRSSCRDMFTPFCSTLRSTRTHVPRRPSLRHMIDRDAFGMSQ